MPSRFRTIRWLAYFAFAGSAILHAQTAKPESGFYGEHTLQLTVGADNSLEGYFYDETGAGKFSCGFLLKSTAAPTKDGVYKIVSWWPAKELGEPVDDEVSNGTLRISGASLTLQLPKNAHGGCWNVNAELNNGEPVELSRDATQPAWRALRVVKAKRVPLRRQPSPAAPSRPYIVQGDVVVVTAAKGSWLQVDFYSYMAGKQFTGWIQDSDLLPPL